MTRVALLPTPGDPFLNKLWFTLFESRWQNEVDKLYVLVNSRIEPKVIAFLTKMYQSNPKVKFMYVDHMMEHGWALKELVLACKEDLVLLIEDDGMIFKSGAVKEQFDRIENGEVDVIGGQRQSSTPGIAIATMNKFSTGNMEAFLWPNFLFTKREYLMKTDLVFGSKGFKAGDKVPYLDWTTEQDEVMDTFGWGAIQLRAQGLRISLMEQYHAMGNDLYSHSFGYRMWDGKAKWTHWGSLSGMMTNWLVDKKGRPLESRQFAQEKNPYDITNSDPMDNPDVVSDFESRIAHISLAFELTQEECNEIDEFRSEYREAIKRVIQVFHLSNALIQGKMNIYKELFNL